MNINNSNRPYSTPSFTSTARQYIRAVRHLKHFKIKEEKAFFAYREESMKKYKHVPKSFFDINPKITIFSQSNAALELEQHGVKSLNIDRLEGIQYGIDVFKDLTMREIVFLAYRSANIAIKRGCANMCAHCFQNAKPASKTELNILPFEDFKKFANGFMIINNRINKILGNESNSHFIGEKDNTRFLREATQAAFFYDSDGMNVIAKDKNGKEHDYEDLAEMFYNATGRMILFDTAGWNPDNIILQQRAEKYAEYFSRPETSTRLEFNLSVNPFNRMYLKAYELGYRPGKENDLSNPDIQRGKIVYDKYIYRIANMLVTLGTIDKAYLLMTFSTKYEKNMDGMCISDLTLILNDVEKKCDEILKNKYPEDEYKQKIQKISHLISNSIERNSNNYEHSSNRCAYKGRYKELFNSRNPQYPREDTRYTINIPDINALSYNDYLQFLKNYSAVIDTNGNLYYQRYDVSVRPLKKSLRLSTSGKQTPAINNLEQRN